MVDVIDPATIAHGLAVPDRELIERIGAGEHVFSDDVLSQRGVFLHSLAVISEYDRPGELVLTLTSRGRDVYELLLGSIAP